YSIFFFQAEDGIRDRNVTGVQTCALPILAGIRPGGYRCGVETDPGPGTRLSRPGTEPARPGGRARRFRHGVGDGLGAVHVAKGRSEERRVGKEGRSGGAEVYDKRQGGEER